jgi:hypothetical protein
MWLLCCFLVFDMVNYGLRLTIPSFHGTSRITTLSTSAVCIASGAKSPRNDRARDDVERRHTGPVLNHKYI